MPSSARAALRPAHAHRILRRVTETSPARRAARRRRGLLLAVALLLGGAGASDPVVAQVNITINPAMTTGPAGARVTIVEFSDYQ
jgi:hypothetical protein